MTCERFERDLALDVGGDLPADAAAALESHLRTCQPCRAFRRSLERSQHWLKAAAAAPLADAELEAVRRRVWATLQQPATPAPLADRRLWAVAAGIALLVVSFGIRRLGQTPERPTPSAAVLTARAGVEVAPRVRPRSHPRAVVVAAAGRERMSRPERLTTEEADQLARAVVLVSRLERVPEERPEREDRTERAPETPFVKLLTADPDVVIYCQVEQNGG
jgi:hypothetical protein